ncbi:unnamed protein product [Strongylus vulgaris]|uniref:Fatty acyl-CoA reductase n=1 Tax=Strongylus vulgaris TaxID=40348 RepID=A0A3P7L6B4_STRVU|nr:unnamed protein product [Strongylus vulgaris]
MSLRVKDVYSERSILLTGSTGFLGKNLLYSTVTLSALAMKVPLKELQVLAEKILWSIPNVGQIFLLIRPAKGMLPRERLDNVLKDPLFNRIRESKPHVLSKLVPISGDLMEDNLGLNQHDMQNICDEVSIVIHSAATVKFDEKLRDAVEMNVMGTTRLVALCHKMKNLVALVHVSTAYANCDRPETEEKVYNPPIAPQKLVEAIQWMDNDMINLITPKLLGKRPNTYTLTKALAESQLVEDAKQLPVIIIRPSIVGAMWRDPLPGWTDNINGPSGIFAAVGKGVLTNMCGSAHVKADIIPVDIVANMIIVAAAHRATTSYQTIPVMHCASGDLNPMKWGKVVIFLEQFYQEYPLQECFSIPSTMFHSSRKMFELHYYLRHHLPAKTMDFVNGLIGRKSKYVLKLRLLYELKHPEITREKRMKLLKTKLLHPFVFHYKIFSNLNSINQWKLNERHVYSSDFYRIDLIILFHARLYARVWRMIEALHYFTTRGWTFQSKNLPMLWDSLCYEDQQQFNFDIRQLDWNSYLFDYTMGVKRYILKDDLNKLQEARAKLTRMRLMRTVLSAGFWYVVVHFFGSRQKRHRKWAAWLIAFSTSHFLLNYNFRPKIPLKSLEEYKRTAYC